MGDPSCFKKKPPRSLMLMKKSSQMSFLLTQHTSPAMPAYKIQVMKSKILNKTFWMISSSTTDLPPNGNSMMDFSTSSYSTTDLWMRKFDSGSFSQSGLPPRVYLDLQLTSFWRNSKAFSNKAMRSRLLFPRMSALFYGLPDKFQFSKWIMAASITISEWRKGFNTV